MPSGFEHMSLKDNPARKLKSPAVTEMPPLPFSRDEFQRVIKACDRYEGKNAEMLQAFVLLLRYSGLRIRDAVTLGRDRISNGKLFLYTAKTGSPTARLFGGLGRLAEERGVELLLVGRQQQT